MFSSIKKKARLKCTAIQVTYSGNGTRSDKTPHPIQISGAAKNIFIESQRMTVSFRTIWARSETAYLYNRQRLILPRTTNTRGT